jgi:hypothetical protein
MEFLLDVCFNAIAELIRYPIAWLLAKIWNRAGRKNRMGPDHFGAHFFASAG